MEPMTKKEKFKKFVSDHREVITKVTVYTTLVVGSIVVVAKALSDIEDIKEGNAKRLEDHNSWVEEENAWIDEKKAEGNDIYLLHDWTYLLVPKDTKTEWVNDREPRKHP